MADATIALEAERLNRAKRAFSTRRVGPDDMRVLIGGTLRPESGDLVLARVEHLGRQKKLELTDGRRAALFPGDEIVVSYGNRYAPDQYEAIIGPDLSRCGLVAAGGVAGNEIARHVKILPATSITPIGLIGDAEGRRLNLRDYRIQTSMREPAIPVILSLGTSMNAGKTLTSMSVVRGFKRAGLRVAALKSTGTGSGGDLWIMRDAGADCVLDFTDAGYASTYLKPIPELELAYRRLLCAAEDAGCDIAVVEIADGLRQLETAQLIESEAIKQCVVGVTFASYDSMGAMSGVDILRKAGHDVMALSGRLGMSPLGVREAEAATGLTLLAPLEFQEGALVPRVLEAIERSGRPVPKALALPDAVLAVGALPQGAWVNGDNGAANGSHEGVFPAGSPVEINWATASSIHDDSYDDQDREPDFDWSAPSPISRPESTVTRPVFVRADANGRVPVMGRRIA